jgi:hypothetical protein
MSYRRRKGGGDPHWLHAIYSGTCAGCGEEFEAGELIFYYPNGRKVFTGKCAEKAAADFAACVADEKMVSLIEKYRG